MSEQKPMQATPSADLEQQIMDPNIPKNEREHWAAGEIHRLRDILNGGCPMHPSAPCTPPAPLGIDDQLIIAVNILRAAELHGAADWIAKNATAFTDRKIAEVSEPFQFASERRALHDGVLPPEIVALHRPITNEEHGTEPGLISGYCHRCRIPWPCLFSPERFTPPTSEPSRTDAVKETEPSVALPNTPTTGTIFGNCNGRRCGNLQAIEEFERLLAATEKRAKDAEAENLIHLSGIDAVLKSWTCLRNTDAVDCGHVICRERHFLAQYADLTRKLATARGGLMRIKSQHAGETVDREEFTCTRIARETIAAIDAPAGEGAASVVLVAITPEPRVIDGKFRAEVRDGRVVIVKTSSGEIVPDDEPLVLMRGRDYLILPTLGYYRERCRLDGCNNYQLGLVDELIAKFVAYASDPARMKQPGITRGAPWNPDDAPPPEPANAQGSDQRCANCHRKNCYLPGHFPMSDDIPTSAPPFTAEERARCVDCGIPYGGDDWLDLMLPDDQWGLIQSPDKENGILCASCIVRRAKRVPHADAIRAVISIMPQRDDALERAAEAVVAAWGGEARNASNDLMNSKMTALYDALTAAQRAKGKQ